MEPNKIQELANDLIGSAHVLVAAVLSMKNEVLAETAGKRLSFSQLKILKLIDLVGPQQVGEVAAFLGVSDAAASKTAEHLVMRKYLRRAVVRPDRRRSELSLTAAGRKLLMQYDASKDRMLASVFAGLDRNEVRRTTEFLERIATGIVNGSVNAEEICLQCGIYLRKRCLVREAVRADCQYHKRRNSQEAAGQARRTGVSKHPAAGLVLPR